MARPKEIKSDFRTVSVSHAEAVIDAEISGWFVSIHPWNGCIPETGFGIYRMADLHSAE